MKIISSHEAKPVDIQVAPPRIGMALLHRVWLALSGVIIIIAAPAFLNSVELGTYYTFNSLLATQIFFDLGFNYVIMQVASGEFAKVERLGNSQLGGDSSRIDRAASLVSLVFKWYAFASLIFFFVVSAGGYLFLDLSAKQLRTLTGPWVATCVVAALNLYISPFMAINEGFGNVHQAARIRLVSSMFGCLLFVGLLAAGAGLWAVPFYLLPNALLALIWVFKPRSLINVLLARAKNGLAHRISWSQEIFPFQWRISVSWMSGYFIYQLITPVIYKTQGPVEAGRIGLALSVFTGILGFGAAWSNAILPTLVKQIKLKDQAGLLLTLRRAFNKSTTAIVIGCLGVVVTYQFGKDYYHFLQYKLPDASALVCFAIATVANHVIYVFATYLRAFGEEVLTVPSVCSALVTLLGVLIAAMRYPSVIPVVYCCSILLILLPWTYRMYRMRRIKESVAASFYGGEKI